MDDVNLSKYLSFVLLHDPDAIDLSLDTQGWANIPMLIRKSREHGTIFSRDDLNRVVNNNDKKRFTISGEKIRAAQGHSIDVKLDLTSQSPPDKLFHGTASRFLDAIYKEGLTSQDRQHVHLSPDIDTAIKIGSRHGKAVVLKIEVERMKSKGLKFYQADNGIWLTDYVPNDCFSLSFIEEEQNYG